MRSWTIAFLLGTLGVQHSAELPPPWQGWAMLALAFLFVVASMQWQRVLPLAGLVAGIGWSWVFGNLQLDASFPAGLEGEDLVVEGIVHSLPESAGTRVRFDFQVQTMRHQGRPIPGVRRIRLSWYDCPNSPSVGERWRFTVRLKRPGG